MKKILALLFLCGFLIQVSISQNQKIDSLINSLSQLKEDTAKLKTLFVITKEYNDQYNDDAKKYSLELVKIANKINTPFEIGKAYNSLANYYYNFVQLDSATYFYNKALEFFEDGNYEKNIIDVLFNISSVYLESNNFIQAQTYLDSVFIFALKERDSILIFDYYQSSGYLNEDKGDYNKAMKFHILSIEIANRINDMTKIANANRNIGLIHYIIGNPDLAHEYFSNALKLDLKNAREYQLPIHYQNIGLTFDYKEEFDSALYYYHKAAKLNLKLNKKLSLARNYNNIGVIHSLQGDYTKAEKYYLKALPIKEESNNLYDIASSNLNLGDIYTSLGNLEEAKIHLSKGAQLADELNILYLKQIANNYFSVYFEKQGKYKKALEHYRKHKVQMDSLLNEEKLSIIERYEIRYQTKQKEDSIAQQSLQLLMNKKETETKNRKLINRRNLIVGIGLLTVLLIFFQIYLQRKNRIIEEMNKQLENEKLQIETLITEVQHRIKNNLLFASSVLDLQSQEIDDKYVQAAVSEGRNRIEAMGLLHQRLLYYEKDPTSIEMQSYLGDLIQNLSLAYDPHSNIELSLNIDPIILDVDKAMRIGLIVNELITNTYKHIDKDLSHPRLDIVLKESEYLYLSVQDNGKGFTEGFNANLRRSFGLQLVQLLTQQLNGKLEIKNFPGACYELIFEK